MAESIANNTIPLATTSAPNHTDTVHASSIPSLMSAGGDRSCSSPLEGPQWWHRLLSMLNHTDPTRLPVALIRTVQWIMCDMLHGEIPPPPSTISSVEDARLLDADGAPERVSLSLDGGHCDVSRDAPDRANHHMHDAACYTKRHPCR